MAEERWNKRNARAYERYIKIAPKKEEEQFWKNVIVNSSIKKMLLSSI